MYDDVSEAENFWGMITTENDFIVLMTNLRLQMSFVSLASRFPFELHNIKHSS